MNKADLIDAVAESADISKAAAARCVDTVFDSITSSLAKLPARTRTLVTQEHRYTRNSAGEEQLFNLSADPDEMTDLNAEQPELRVAMLEQLAQALMMADDSSRGAPATKVSA